MAATKRNTSRKKANLKTSQAQRFLEKAEKLMNTFSHDLSIRELDSFHIIINPDNQDRVSLIGSEVPGRVKTRNMSPCESSYIKTKYLANMTFYVVLRSGPTFTFNYPAYDTSR
ncbi:MAG: hypothetical protein ABJH04_07660 [Cyclobacteriaceae bacterium]